MALKRRPSYETILVAIVVIITVVLGIGIYSGRARVDKTRLLIRELSVLRQAVTHYKIVNHRFPASLDDLASATYESESGPRAFVDRVPRDEKGNIADPFGSPYRYEPADGWVSSVSAGFERW